VAVASTCTSSTVACVRAQVLSTLNPARFSLILVEVWEENVNFADSGMTVHDHLHQVRHCASSRATVREHPFVQ
jgi:hypothetical protein